MMSASADPRAGRRAQLLELIAHVRRVLGDRAQHLPHGYVLAPAIDPHDECTKWSLLSQSGCSCWLTARAVEACAQTSSQYPLRLWGKLPIRLELPDAADTDGRLALVYVRGLVYPDDHRIGSTVVQAELNALGGGAVVLLAPSPIPGWPSTAPR